MKNKNFFLSKMGFFGLFLGVIAFVFEMYGLKFIQDSSGQTLAKNGNNIFNLAFITIATPTSIGVIIGIGIDLLIKSIFGIEKYQRITENTENIIGLIKMLILGAIGAGLGYVGATDGLHWGAIGGIILAIIGFFIGSIISLIG